jgi:hypothetical protein
MLGLPLALTAQLWVAAPTPEQVKEVFDHFWAGQGKGAILADAVLCKNVQQNKKDPKFLECIEPAGEAVSKGDSLHVYVTFLIPNGDKIESVTVQAVHEGQVRETHDLALKGDFIRTRTWTTFKVSKPGKWEFRVQDGDKTLKTLSVNAT